MSMAGSEMRRLFFVRCQRCFYIPERASGSPIRPTPSCFNSTDQSIQTSDRDHFLHGVKAGRFTVPKTDDRPTSAHETLRFRENEPSPVVSALLGL